MPVSIQRLFLVLLSVGAIAAPAHAQSRAAVLQSGLPGEDASVIDAVASRITASGYAVSRIDLAGLCDSTVLDSNKIDLLVLPDSGSLPVDAMRTIDDFARGGGDIIALDTPMWRRPLINVNGQWTTREEYFAQPRDIKPSHLLADFTPESIAKWQWSSDDGSRKTKRETVADGPGGQRALHVTLPDLSGWDVFGPDSLDSPFAPGETLTVFSAKGGPNTPQLSLEWREKDGSRWIATVDLTDQWRQYVLAPQDFHYHPSNGARGFQDDRFKPENAVAMQVGLAIGLTDSPATQPQEYWVGPIGTMAATPELAKVLADYPEPQLDSLCPAYRLLECTGVGSLKARFDQAIGAQGDLPVPKVIRSPFPRARAGGFNKGRAWRWIPLVEARTANGEWRGDPATLYIHTDGLYEGSTWASFGIGDAAWYKTAQALDCIGRVAEAMRRGVYILDAGSDQFTYFEDQQPKLGAKIVNQGSADADVTVRVRVIDRATSQQVYENNWPLKIPADETSSISADWRPDKWADTGYRVDVDVLSGGNVIDRVSHTLDVYRPKTTKSFVTTRNGDFYLDGKPWRAHGINYIATYGSAVKDYELSRRWLRADAYDPEVVQRDLEKIKDMGFNSVSIYVIGDEFRDMNLLDALRRIESLGLKANLFVTNKPEFAANLIQLYRLADNDTVCAYDIDWEPTWGTQEDRRKWDADWRTWIVNRYGSVENAEKDWGVPAPRDNGGVITNPDGNQVDNDGPWRRMVAAYRRFLDTVLYKRYSAIREQIRAVDPNHLVSFRMSDGGSPTFRAGGRMVYDFPYLAGALDFLSPEGYGRVGTWERTKPGWFEREYARWAAPEKPMIWAEAGVNALDSSKMTVSPVRLEYQAQAYRNFYRMLTSSGANGVFFWFYSGGLNCKEVSDYGIINPDGSDRDVTRVIRENARAFIDGPDPKPQSRSITFDRDRYPDGLFGVYQATQQTFWKSVDGGQVPALKTAGTGTTSANCPLEAVGNTRCNGTNPPKYLDGIFRQVEVLDYDGKWIPVTDGEQVRVSWKQPVLARVTMTNLGEARWVSRAAKDAGVVYLAAQGTERLRTPLPADVPRFGSVTVQNVILLPAGLRQWQDVTIVLTASGRTDFGERLTLTLHP